MKIKRLTAFMLSLIMLITLMAYAEALSDISEDMNKCGDNITWSLSDGTLRISGYGDMKDFSIDESPWSKDEVKDVRIEEGVRSVGKYAFAKCQFLTDISLPKSLENIGEGAFYKCGLLGRIELPEGLTKISGSAFKYCHSLRYVKIGNNVSYIGSNAFEQCSELSEISLNNVEIIGDMAFYGCKSLSRIVIPSSVKEIGYKAFGTADTIGGGLKEIVFEGGQIDIKKDAFENITADVYYTEEKWNSFESYGGNLNPKTKHNMQYVPERKADCINDGSKGYWKCSDRGCAGKMFADENGQSEISSDEIVIKAYGHDWKKQEYSSCTDTQTVYVCSGCGKTKTEPRKAGHIPSEPVEEIISVPDSLTGVGRCDEVVYCSVCGKPIRRETKPLVYNISLSEDGYVYDGTYKYPKPEIKLGNKKIEEYLYDTEYTDNINAGTGYVKITAKSGAIIKGTAKMNFKIEPCPLTDKAAVLSKSTYTYSGKQIKPAVNIESLVYNKDYTVIYGNNKNVGTAYAVAQGKGNYTGRSAPAEYDILPRTVKISKLTADAKGLTVFWKKQTVQATGYRIAYSDKKDFSSQKVKNISDKNKSSYSVKNLKAKKRYYVKIGVYTLVNDKKYYSEWSDIQTVKTK